MNFLKILIACVLTNICLSDVLSQRNVTFTTTEPVEITVKRRSGLKAAPENNQIFRVSENRSLYVRSFYSPYNPSSQHRVNAFLFGPDGQLISSNTSMMQSGEMGEDNVLEIVQHADRIIVITVRDDSQNFICKFWDITEASEPKKVKEVLFVKQTKAEPLPMVALSSKQNFLGLISGNAHNLVVVDRDFDTAYEKSLVASKKEGGNKDNYVDAFAIDDEGYVSLSILFQEPTGFFSNSTSGSLLFLGIDILEDKITAWNLAEVLSMSHFSKYYSKIKSLEGGKVFYMYGTLGLNSALFDLKTGSVIGTNSIKEADLFPGDLKLYEYRKTSVLGISELEDGRIAVKISRDGNKQNGDYILFYNKNLDKVNTFKIEWGQIGWWFGKKWAIIENEIYLPNFAMQNALSELEKGSKIETKFDTKKAIKNVVAYNAVTNNYYWFPLPSNNKAKEKDFDFVMSDDGFMAWLDFKGNSATIKFHDLKQK